MDAENNCMPPLASANSVNVIMLGFIQSISELMSEPGNTELNILACRTLV